MLQNGGYGESMESLLDSVYARISHSIAGMKSCAISGTDKLRWERDVWQGAAYGLAGQVSETKQLSTLRRVQLGEKVWVTLARHFTTLLSSQDTQQVNW